MNFWLYYSHNTSRGFVHELWYEWDEKWGQVKDQNTLVPHALCSFFSAGNNRVAKTRCYFGNSHESEIFFCFTWQISLGVQKKTAYLADTSEAVPISLCGNKDPPQPWVHPEWQPWSHPQRLRQLRASSACHLTGTTRKRNSGWHREQENNNKRSTAETELSKRKQNWILRRQCCYCFRPSGSHKLQDRG